MVGFLLFPFKVWKTKGGVQFGVLVEVVVPLPCFGLGDRGLFNFLDWTREGRFGQAFKQLTIQLGVFFCWGPQKVWL